MQTVTFDSNVWEKIVKKETKEHEYIYNQISLGNIRAYISEIAISLESLKKKERLGFMRNYKPNITIEDVNINQETGTIHQRLCFSPNLEAHLGLYSKLKESLILAQKLGFMILPMTNLGTVRSPEIPEEMKEEIADFWDYAEKLNECSKFISDMRCGSFKYFSFKNSMLTDPRIEINEKEFSKAIAEWVDGEMLSAH